MASKLNLEIEFDKFCESVLNQSFYEKYPINKIKYMLEYFAEIQKKNSQLRP